MPTEALTPLWGGAGLTAGAVALQCNSAVAEHMSPKLGQWVGRIQRKYDKFTHRLNVGVEHRQMHRRAPAPKQEQRVKKQKSHTVTLFPPYLARACCCVCDLRPGSCRVGSHCVPVVFGHMFGHSAFCFFLFFFVLRLWPSRDATTRTDAFPWGAWPRGAAVDTRK